MIYFLLELFRFAKMYMNDTGCYFSIFFLRLPLPLLLVAFLSTCFFFLLLTDFFFPAAIMLLQAFQVSSFCLSSLHFGPFSIIYSHMFMFHLFFFTRPIRLFLCLPLSLLPFTTIIITHLFLHRVFTSSQSWSFALLPTLLSLTFTFLFACKFVPFYFGVFFFIPL